jgi:hypothetical protein
MPLGRLYGDVPVEIKAGAEVGWQTDTRRSIVLLLRTDTSKFAPYWLWATERKFAAGP